jgi:hypothetical protein
MCGILSPSFIFFQGEQHPYISAPLTLDYIFPYDFCEVLFERGVTF